MAIKPTTLDEATEEQVRAYASDFLNLDVPEGADHTALVAMIERAQPNNRSMFYEEKPAPAEAAPEGPSEELGSSKGQMGSLGKNDPRWTINIPIVDTEDNSGKNDVLVGVNGRAWQIKRGVDVSVPHRVVVALQNAETNIIRHDEEGDVVQRLAKRFPFHAVEMPTQAEIDHWTEITGKQFCA
jgi:hypothetical protein